MKLFDVLQKLTDLNAMYIPDTQKDNTDSKFKITSDHYKLNSVVFNETRANISLSYSAEGVVRLDENASKYDLVEEHKSKIFRNLGIVKDGNLVIEGLMLYCESDLSSFASPSPEENNVYYIDLTKYELKSENNTSAEELLNQEVKYNELSAKFKVLSSIINKEDKVTLFNEEQINYLKQFNVSYLNYYNEPIKYTKSDATYPEINMFIKGISSIPSVNAINKKISEGSKLNSIESLMESYQKTYSLDGVDAFKEYSDVKSELKLIEIKRSLDKLAIHFGTFDMHSFEKNEDTYEFKKGETTLIIKKKNF